LGNPIYLSRQFSNEMNHLATIHGSQPDNRQTEPCSRGNQPACCHDPEGKWLEQISTTTETLQTPCRNDQTSAPSDTANKTATGIELTNIRPKTWILLSVYPSDEVRRLTKQPHLSHSSVKAPVPVRTHCTNA